MFFEVGEKEQSSCKIAEELFDRDIPGYTGGLLLRAAGIDPNVTGYYHSNRPYYDGTETVNSLPLVREINDLQVNEHGFPIEVEQGDMFEAFRVEVEQGDIPESFQAYPRQEFPSEFRRFPFHPSMQSEGATVVRREINLYNPAYRPKVKGIELTWSYNSFPQFVADTLEWVEQRERFSSGPRRAVYGISYLAPDT